MRSHLKKEHKQFINEDDFEADREYREHTDESEVKKHKHEIVDEALLRFVVKSSLPFRVVEQETFKELFSKLDRSYKIPSRYKLSTTLLDNEYSRLINSIKIELSDCESVSLSSDIWTSSQHYPYIGVTVHFFDKNVNLCSRTLNLHHLPGSHSAENISEALFNVIKEWDLLVKVFGLVMDNASNCNNVGEEITAKINNLLNSQSSFASSLNTIQISQLGCNAHILNLIVAKLTKVLDRNENCEDSDLVLDERDTIMMNRYLELVKKCRDIVSLFDQSTRMREVLKEKQVELDLPQHMLIQDVQHRWNSTYEMVLRVDEQFDVCLNKFII